MSADRRKDIAPLLRALVLWVLLAAGAVGVLLAVRSGGSALQLRAKVDSLLLNAKTSYGAGRLPDAQRDLLQALYLAPTALPRIAEEFGPAVLNMPLLHEAMERSANETDPGLAGAALGLGPSNAKSDPRIEARLALAEGRLADAKRFFDEFHTTNPDTAPKETALALFDAGFWPEAVKAARSEDDEALALAVEGAQFEAEGEFESARARYNASLDQDGAVVIALQGAARLTNNR